MPRDKEFTLELIVAIPGYGKEKDQEQISANIKRLLEVKLARKISVKRMTDSGLREVYRTDRNANS